MVKRAEPGEAALQRVATQFRGKRAAKVLLGKADTPPQAPSLTSTLARYREDGLLQPSRKGAR